MMKTPGAGSTASIFATPLVATDATGSVPKQGISLGGVRRTTLDTTLLSRHGKTPSVTMPKMKSPAQT